ncbi:GDP-mannose 4,6-dehydratase [Candidatus Daviesbacteria bacterium]|nr:GDP-mannose 4,6-dehydratase [Candidatus Daviesbacteria bacterium]
MKVIVTGGAGFVGSHLCGKLIESGNQVICLDNLLTGSRGNIKHLEENPNFEFLEFDVCKRLPDTLEADQVYHLASPASPNLHSKKSYHALPFETMIVNTQGTWGLARFCLQRKAKFLFASTSEVYGDPLEHPQTEEYKGNVSTTGPRSVYDESKRFGETIVAAFVRSKGLDGRIVRIFNTYGPRMALDDGRVIIEFIKPALVNKPLPVFGDGEGTRSFCYVDDLVEGIIRAMNTPNTKGEVFNLGNPSEIKIINLAKKVIEMTNSNSTIDFSQPLPEDDPKRRCPDISKAKDKLGWEPQVDLEAGLKLLIESLK